MLRLLLVAILLAPAPALAKGDKAAFVKNMTMLVYTEQRCPGLRVNMALLAMAAPSFGVKASDVEPGGALAGEAADQRRKMVETFGGYKDADFCALMEDFFGPGGTIAPGVIKRR